MTSSEQPRLPAVAKLRALLSDPNKIVVCPGVYDGLSARIALREGFECLYMTGAGTTISRLGMADLGIATLNDMVENAAMIASLDPNVPVIADADTGYGGPLNIRRTLHSYMRAGVAGLHLEDQITTKRCGHLSNKELVSEGEFVTRIRAAVNARTEYQTLHQYTNTKSNTPGASADPTSNSRDDIVIIARTDALASLGYDAAISRLRAALDAGADVAFLEGVTSTEVAKRVCADLKPSPVLFNNVPGGVSPDLSVAEAQEAGFRLVIFPILALGVVHQGITAVFQRLKQRGSGSGLQDLVQVPTQPEEEDIEGVRKLGTVRELFNVSGLKEAVEFDVAAGGQHYAKGA